VNGRSAEFARFDPRREVDYIRNCAREGAAKVVTLGPFVFFCTPAGDAWVLDAEDRFAACVMRDFAEVPFEIGETETQWRVTWPATFTHKGQTLTITTTATGEETKMRGALVRELDRSLRLARNSGGLRGPGPA